MLQQAETLYWQELHTGLFYLMSGLERLVPVHLPTPVLRLACTDQDSRPAAVVGGGGRVHPPGLRAPAQRWRLWRLVLPLPREPLRCSRPCPQGASSLQP